MKPALSITVNLDVPKTKSQWTLKERIRTENGVTTIRPYRNGVPGGTELEVAECIAEFERAIDAGNKKARIEIDLLVAQSWDANGSPV